MDFQPKEYSPIICSFCGNDRWQAKKIIVGPGVFICDVCARRYSEEIHNTQRRRPRKLINALTPHQIKERLDQHVIGQEATKRALSVAVYNHYKRLAYGDAYDGVEIQKSNILLIGPTGTGKTLLAQTLAGFLNVPFVMVDATAYTQAGYAGEHVENMIQNLLQNADEEVKQACRGIIYIDEVDKLAQKRPGVSGSRDVSGEGVQQALLKVLEGASVNVPLKGSRNYPRQAYFKVDTGNILFICGGAFIGLEKIVTRRAGARSIGFQSTTEGAAADATLEWLKLLQAEDLIQYGFIPEFIGRLPVVCTLHHLDEDDLIRILTEPKNALIRQYQFFFETHGVHLRVTDKALHAIARKALARRSGARGLRAVMEMLMLDLMYEVPSMADIAECVIDEKVICNGDRPKLKFHAVRQLA